MTNDGNGRVILITGSSKGIGKELVNHYLTCGDIVVGCSRTDVNITSDKYHHFCLDVSKEEEVKHMMLYIRKNLGRLDVLINNAAINPYIGLAFMVPIESVVKTMNVNFIGTCITSREAAKLMKKRQFGRIINFGSMATKLEVRGESFYTASKAAVLSFSRIFAKEVFPLGITCNVVSPSVIDTELAAAINKEALNEVLQQNAINEYGEIKDIVNIIDWLIRPESQSITGQVVYQGGV